MGLLLTTVTKQEAPTDPFTSGKFTQPMIQANQEGGKIAVEDLPFPAYACFVKIDDKIVGLFQSISSLEIKRDVEAVHQGGENDRVIELPGEMSYGHVTLKSCYSTSTLFMDWMLTGNFNGHPIKKDIVVTLGHYSMDKTSIQMDKTFQFHGAYPVNWKLSDLSVDDTEKVLFESIEFAYKDIGE